MISQTKTGAAVIKVNLIGAAERLYRAGAFLARTPRAWVAVVYTLFFLAICRPGSAQTLTVVTDPAGFYSIALSSNSDTVVSLPFCRPAVFVGQIVSVASNVIAVTGNPNWTANQFVYAAGTQSNTYYAFLNTGSGAGNHFTITNNTTNTLSLDLGSGSLTNVAVSNSVAIIPFWTLGTALSVGAGILDSPRPGNRSTEILVPDLAGVGTNLSAGRMYYHWNGNWRAVGQGNGVKDDDVLLSDTYFIVRHNLASNTVLTTFGAVPMKQLQIALATDAVKKRDNSVALARPAVATLTQSMLYESGAFTASSATNAHTDELLTFDNTLAQKNKTPTAIYYYWSNAWRQVGAGTNDVGSVPIFAPGTGVIVRKNTNSGSPTVRWINLPNY